MFADKQMTQQAADYSSFIFNQNGVVFSVKGIYDMSSVSSAGFFLFVSNLKEKEVPNIALLI